MLSSRPFATHLKDIFMRIIRRLFLAAAALAFAGSAFAAGPAFTTLTTPQRTESGNKIEVIEFFMYHCPHCNRLEPLMAAWVKKQGDAIAFRRIHLQFEPNDAQAHAYVTLEAMGKLGEMHDKIFHAIHVENQRLSTDDSLLAFMVKNGIDKTKYLEFFNSFAVQTKMKRSGQLMSEYGINSAPAIAIDGRFVTSPSLAGQPGMTEPQSQAATIAVMDSLVAKVQKETGRGVAAAPAPAAAPAAAKPVKK